MRFIVMHKVDPHMEAGGAPSQDIIKNMGELVQGSLKDGTFLNGAGLHRSARRVRLTSHGEMQAGPYPGGNELVASFAMISAKSLDAAVSCARELSAALDHAEIEVGPVVEPWDLGMMDKPANAPERFLLLCKASTTDESVDTSAKHARAVQRLSSALGSAGSVLAAESLAPSRQGARLHANREGGKRTWVDGPFAESKELIAGFSMLRVPSKASALAWADRYASILTINEIDVRELNDPPA
jgi:hypothetical protein